MLPLAHAGLTTPAVAGPGCNEWLGLTELTQAEALLVFQNRICRALQRITSV